MISQTMIDSYLDSIAYQVQTLAPEKASHTHLGVNRDIQANEKIQFDLNRVNDIRNLAYRIACEYEQTESALQTIDRVIFKFGLDSSVSIFEVLQRVDACVYGSKKANRELDLRKLELRLREIFSGDFGIESGDYQPGISKRGTHPAEIADKRYHGGNYE